MGVGDGFWREHPWIHLIFSLDSCSNSGPGPGAVAAGTERGFRHHPDSEEGVLAIHDLTPPTLRLCPSLSSFPIPL